MSAVDYSFTLCHCDWFSKQADWSSAEQNIATRESQAENDGMRKGGVIGVTSRGRRR